MWQRGKRVTFVALSAFHPLLLLIYFNIYYLYVYLTDWLIYLFILQTLVLDYVILLLLFQHSGRIVFWLSSNHLGYSSRSCIPASYRPVDLDAGISKIWPRHVEILKIKLYTVFRNCDNNCDQPFVMRTYVNKTGGGFIHRKCHRMLLTCSSALALSDCRKNRLWPGYFLPKPFLSVLKRV